jgi:hypothetical protein
MSDIVERLRAERPAFYESVMREAAAEIERLRAVLKSAPRPTPEHAWLLKYVDWWEKNQARTG